MPNLRILTKYCKGCGLCIEACPKNKLYLQKEVDRRGVHVVAPHPAIECSGCGNCVAMCPDAALEIAE